MTISDISEIGKDKGTTLTVEPCLRVVIVCYKFFFLVKSKETLNYMPRSCSFTITNAKRYEIRYE